MLTAVVCGLGFLKRLKFLNVPGATDSRLYCRRRIPTGGVPLCSGRSPGSCLGTKIGAPDLRVRKGPSTYTDRCGQQSPFCVSWRTFSTATLYNLMCSQRRYTNPTSRCKDVKEAVESRGCKGRSLRTPSRSYLVFR